MRDGSAIAVATDAAAIAVRDGDLAAAQAALRSDCDAACASATAAIQPDAEIPPFAEIPLDVAETASLYARGLAATGSTRDGLAYSASAYLTACEAAQPGSDLRLRAAATHAYLLRAAGDPAAAVPVGRDLAQQLVARFGATDRRTLAAHGDLAVTLHAAGECLTGRQILHRTGELVRGTYGPDDPLGIRMRHRLADLTRECRPKDAVGAESTDTVADHICGRPNAATVSTVDLFGDLFADVGDQVVRPVDDTADPTDTHPPITDRPAIPSAGLLATLGVAIPTARPPTPAELRVPPAEMPAPAAEAPVPAAEMPVPAAEATVPAAEMPVPAAEATVPAAEVPVAAVSAPAEIGVEPIDASPVDLSVDSHVEVELAEAAESAATTEREDHRAPEASETATAADGGDLSPAADVGGIEAPESDVPPWADRPTAGFPTVPIAVGLHPTWVAAPPEPVSAARPIGTTSTVGGTGNSAADFPFTYSRATFGRMRRLATHASARDRPQRTATTSGSTKTTEGE